MNAAQYKSDLIDLLENSVKGFNKSTSLIEKNIFSKMMKYVNQIEVSADGRIIANDANIKKMMDLNAELNRTIKSNIYFDAVKKYLDAFDTVFALQNKYFAFINSDFSPSEKLRAWRLLAIQQAQSKLVEYMPVVYGDKIKNILITNTTVGASYSDMVDEMRNYIIGSGETGSVGKLQNMAETVVTDALNQFSSSYSELATNDLNLEWYEYVGSLQDNSRVFCQAMVKKRYVHKSELGDIVKGKFPEFKKLGGTIYAKTGLPQGMIDGTNSSNLITRRGGHKCGHQFVPVATIAVPAHIRSKISQ